MIRWVVTGPAGGGKSTLCRLLAARGAVVLDGDLLGHEVLGREGIISAIRDEFGSGVVSAGQVDRGALGTVVFGDPSALARLNRITLEPIGRLAAKRLDELAAGGRYRLAVLEAAVYFLFPPVPGVELVITVTASPEIRLARLVEEKGLPGDKARARIAAQKNLEADWSRADVVLDNGGPLADLQAAAEELWNRVED